MDKDYRVSLLLMGEQSDGVKLRFPGAAVLMMNESTVFLHSFLSVECCLLSPLSHFIKTTTSEKGSFKFLSRVLGLYYTSS